MKLRPYPMHGHRKVGPYRPPLRTLKELAEEFGISWHQLKSDMRYSPVPAPERCIRTAGNTWYEPNAMRRWRRAFLAATQTPTTSTPAEALPALQAQAPLEA